MTNGLPAVFEARNVEFRYGALAVLNDLSLRVQNGEV